MANNITSIKVEDTCSSTGDASLDVNFFDLAAATVKIKQEIVSKTEAATYDTGKINPFSLLETQTWIKKEKVDPLEETSPIKEVPFFINTNSSSVLHKVENLEGEEEEGVTAQDDCNSCILLGNQQDTLCSDGVSSFSSSIIKFDLKDSLQSVPSVLQTSQPFFSCSHCGTIFKTKCILEKHIATHSIKKQFSCRQCNVKTRTKIGLRRHLTTHSNLKQSSLPRNILPRGKITLKDFALGIKDTLSSHLKTKQLFTSIENQKDSPCIDEMNTLPSSIITFDKSDSMEDDLQTTQQFFSCPHCGTSFKTKCILKKHIATHSIKRGYSCQDCNFRTNTKISLIKHVTSHSNIRQISAPCKILPRKTIPLEDISSGNQEGSSCCDKMSAVPSLAMNLNKNDLLHDDLSLLQTNWQFFPCPHCGTSFKTKFDLQKHVASHCGIKRRFFCSLCNVKATTKVGLRRHLATHSSVKKISAFCRILPKENVPLKDVSLSRIENAFSNHLEAMADDIMNIKVENAFSSTGDTTSDINSFNLAAVAVQVEQEVVSEAKAATFDTNKINTFDFSETQTPIKEEKADVLEENLTSLVQETSCFTNISSTSVFHKIENLKINEEGGTAQFNLSSCISPKDQRDSPYSDGVSALPSFISDSDKNEGPQDDVKLQTIQPFFSCAHCGTSFKTKCILEKHVATHRFKKGYPCPHCSLRTKTKIALVKHLSTHSSVRQIPANIIPRKILPYGKIPLGDNSLDTKDDLSNHAQPQILLSCSFCGICFCSEYHLNLHLSTHQLKKWFSCRQCSDTFVTEAYLEQHYLVAHSNASLLSYQQLPVQTSFPCTIFPCPTMPYQNNPVPCVQPLQNIWVVTTFPNM